MWETLTLEDQLPDMFFLLIGSVVSWNSKKQLIIVSSTIKATYKVATNQRSNLVFKDFFRNTAFLPHGLIIIYNSNYTCIFLSKNLTFYIKTIHGKIHHHFVYKKIEEGKIDLVLYTIQDILVNF